MKCLRVPGIFLIFSCVYSLPCELPSFLWEDVIFTFVFCVETFIFCKLKLYWIKPLFLSECLFYSFTIPHSSFPCYNHFHVMPCHCNFIAHILYSLTGAIFLREVEFSWTGAIFCQRSYFFVIGAII